MDIKIKEKYKFTGGDEISHYDAHFESEPNPTLEEFVDWILRKHPEEWGYVRSNEGWTEYVEYRYGEIRRTCADYSEIKGKTISLKRMAGGWTAMDYCIEFD